MSLGMYFSSCHPTLMALSPSVLGSIKQVILSYRDSVESVCVVVPTLDMLADIVGSIPAEVQESTTLRYFVDLSSVGTNKLRLYVDSPDKEVSIIGFYFDSNNALLEKKLYKKDPEDTKALFVDRYNASGVLISADEPEYQSDRSSWLGSAEWADLSEASSYEVRYLHKANKQQSYIYVLGN
jgi:hypothetical protein